jgi:hypothetical protein
LKVQGQLRAIPGGVVGLDLGAALATAAALGVDPLWAAEILPALEPVFVKSVNDRLEAARETRGDGGGRVVLGEGA